MSCMVFVAAADYQVEEISIMSDDDEDGGNGIQGGGPANDGKGGNERKRRHRSVSPQPSEREIALERQVQALKDAEIRRELFALRAKVQTQEAYISAGQGAARQESLDSELNPFGGRPSNLPKVCTRKLK